MIVSEKAAQNLGDVENLNAAKRALMRGEHNAHVYDRYKWFVDQNGLMKKVLPNTGAKITPPPRGKVVPLTSVINHRLLEKAVPGIRGWTASVRPLGGSTRGVTLPGRRHIALSPSVANGSSTWFHEALHAAQQEQGAPLNARGSNPVAAGGYRAYRNNLGEVEARLAGANAPLSSKAQVLMARAQARGVKRPAIKPPPAPAPVKKPAPTKAPAIKSPPTPGKTPAKPKIANPAPLKTKRPGPQEKGAPTSKPRIKNPTSL